MIDDVTVGARFQRISAPFYMWEVERVVTDPEGLPHAHLSRVDSPNDKRMISASTLRNDRFYRPVNADGKCAAPRRTTTSGGILRMFSCFF